MIALLAPGQGAQIPGMLLPWLALDGAEEHVRAWSEAIGLDLRHLGTAAGAEQIKDTAIAQPLIVAVSLLAAQELLRRVGLPAEAPVAGHSVGELAAAAVAGVLTAEETLAFAAVRGREMAAACAAQPTGMAAVLGGDPEEVTAVLARLGLAVANCNGAGQVVAAGPRDALAALEQHKPTRSRVVPLAVAGAFHTRFMAPAEQALARFATRLTPRDPTRPLLSNADGLVIDDGAEMLSRLVAQVTRPVRWDRCMATLHARAVTAVIELPPAGTLCGLVKRDMKGTVTLPLKAPEDLSRAAELSYEHAAIDPSGAPA
jgi:[acyl-carrier-protein] S-malonyltransferase